MLLLIVLIRLISELNIFFKIKIDSDHTLKNINLDL